VYLVEQPITSYAKTINKGLMNTQERNNKYIFSDKDLKVEITSLNKQDATVVMTAKFKNLRNNSFYLGSRKDSMYLLDEDGEQWFYDDDDYGFTFLRPKFEFMPDTWHKITFQFNKPKGSIKSSSFTFLQKVQVKGSFDMIKISVKNIPDGYGS
jgi:hypothetical protein